MLDSIYMILPRSLYVIMNKLPLEIQMQLEEIRVREQRPLEIIYRGKYGFVTADGIITHDSQHGYMPTHEDCMQFLDLLANHSLYTLEEELKRGYITIKGGHRIGLAGRAVLEHGRIQQIREVSSFNIRIAREVINAGKHLMPFLVDTSARTIHHSLIISPPQQGKTTIVRDLARLISYGHFGDAEMKWEGLKVGIVDERSELAACHKGVPSFDVGPRTDVLDNTPKAEGMMMMIRSMSPEVIVVDEIGRKEDVEAIHEALHAGIRVIATAHGQNFEDVTNRPILRELMSEHIFSRYVVLNRSYGSGKASFIYDSNGKRLISDFAKRVIHSNA